MKKPIALAALLATLTLAAIGTPGAAAVTTTHTGWSWGNPRPQGKALFDVDFAGSRGYAVGEFGTLLRTDDGGASWTGLRSGETDAFDRVRAIDADSFVAGGGCTLLRSDDGGQTFRRLRFTSGSSCGSRLAAFDFPSEGIGYLVRADSSVLRTEDGGRTFSARASVPGTGGAVDVHDLLFNDSNNGFAATGGSVAGRILRTSDGGASWTEVGSTGRSVNGLAFPNLGRGYAVGDGGTFLKSTDGGASWTPMDTGTTQNLGEISCTGEDVCTITFEGGDRLLRTDDGGATFDVVVPGGSMGEPLHAVGAASGARAVTVGQVGATFVSDDAGATFARVGGRLAGTFRRLRATSTSVAHAAGDAGLVARTTDGGATWSTLGVPTSAQIVDVSFPTAGLGFAIDSNGALFRTDNGGGSWAILGSGGAANAIAASSDGNTVLLIGPRGVRRSANGGEQFDVVDDTDVGTASLVSGTYNSGTGVLTLVAFGSKTIVFTNDGGRSWSRLKRPPTRSKVVDVDFTDSKRGWALTSDGRVWRTANRGRNWAESLAHGTAGAVDLDFGGSRDGWLVTREFAGEAAGWILHTSDGGASWSPQRVDSSGPLSLVSPASGIGFALNNAGGVSNFFETDNGGTNGVASQISLRSRTRSISGSTRVEVTGAISPSVAGARVQVATRTAGSGSWRRVVVQTSSEGRFKASFRISSTAYFVAQWAGDALRAGDGSTRLTIPRR